MRLEVSFTKFPIVSTFNDARDYELEIDSSLIDAVSAIVEKGNGKPIASGIRWVRPLGDQDGSGYYILTARNKGKVYSLLFQLGANEKSRLVGVYPETANRDELIDVLYDVLSEDADEVNLLI